MNNISSSGLNELNETDNFTCAIVEKSDNIIHYYVDFLYKINNRSLNCDKYLAMKKEIKIGTINGGHFFQYFVEAYLSKKYNIKIMFENNLKECDVIISSWFGNQSINDFKYTTYKIFVSAENRNASLIDRNFDLIIGNINTNENIHAIEYIYYPFYAISLFEQYKYKGITAITKEKTQFCAFMYSVCHQHRENFYNELSKYKEVSPLGKCCSNKTCNAERKFDRWVYNSDFTYQDLAIEKYSDYKFVIAMENESKKGYITEKFMLPVKAGCIPIYWGAEDILEHFPENSFININKYESISACIEYIKEVDNNDELYKEYLENMKKALSQNKYINQLFD
jgi:hypothetical protein